MNNNESNEMNNTTNTNEIYANENNAHTAAIELQSARMLLVDIIAETEELSVHDLGWDGVTAYTQKQTWLHDEECYA